MAFVLGGFVENTQDKPLQYAAVKFCSGCNTSKEKSLFSKDSTRHDGVYPLCKACRAPKSSEYRKRIASQTKVLPAQKTCACCKTTKANTAFKKCKDNLDGLYSYCTDCDKQKRQRMRYRLSYGFSKEEADAFAKNNVGVCEICSARGKLVVDHCHSTGKVRGFVCNSCNVVLGFAKDSPDTLKAAAKYLEQKK